jgi:hypothetical protein
MKGRSDNSDILKNAMTIKNIKIGIATTSAHH